MAFREQDVTVDEFLRYALNGYTFCNLFDYNPNKEYWFETGDGHRYHTTPLYKGVTNKDFMRLEFKSDRFFCGAQTVFVDIDPETLDIDASKIEEKITCHTVAIMPVHVFGNNCDFEAIEAVAKAHNLPVIYDACHSVGSTYKGESVFKQGTMSVTSFHATKMLNTAEGGGVLTLDKEIDEKLRRIRFFGFENHADIVEDGFNGKMTEVHAALGIANLRYLDAALADRKEKYARYKEILSQNPEINFQKITTGCNYSYIPAIFKDEETALKVVAALNAENIFPRRYFYPSVNTFTKLVPYIPMPKSEDIASRILCLPLYKGLKMQDVEDIANITLKSI